MSQLRGGIGQSLNAILDVLGSTLRLTEIQDSEGVFPVVDVSAAAAAELYVQDTRGFDTGNIAQSTTSVQTISGLPALFTFLGLFISTDDSARLNRVQVDAQNVGTPGAVRDWPLFLWLAGDPTLNIGANWEIGDAALGTLLRPGNTQRWWDLPGAHVMTTQAGSVSRQGITNIRVRVVSSGFGAGTVRCTGHIVIGFFRRNRSVVAVRPF